MKYHINYEGKNFVHDTLKDGTDFYVKDKAGKEYHFKISSLVAGPGLLSEAIEVKDDVDDQNRYIFRILSEFATEPEVATLKLKAKILRSINRTHMIKMNNEWQISEERNLSGRITSALDEPDTTHKMVLIIDGKRITIEEFARMIEMYEGFDFSFQIVESSEEEKSEDAHEE